MWGSVTWNEWVQSEECVVNKGNMDKNEWVEKWKKYGIHMCKDQV